MRDYGKRSKTFTNEYDRKITISVRPSYKKGGSRPGKRLNIKIKGPDSTATNELTPKEGAVLKDLL